MVVHGVLMKGERRTDGKGVVEHESEMKTLLSEVAPL